MPLPKTLLLLSISDVANFDDFIDLARWHECIFETTKTYYLFLLGISKDSIEFNRIKLIKIHYVSLNFLSRHSSQGERPVQLFETDIHVKDFYFKVRNKRFVFHLSQFFLFLVQICQILNFCTRSQWIQASKNWIDWRKCGNKMKFFNYFLY